MMTRPSAHGCLLAAWLVLTGSPALGAESGEDFSREASRQQSIYRASGDNRDPGYVVDRGLDFYAYTLAEDFGRTLPRLQPGERWLDVGAGRGQAIIDYFTPGYRSDSLKASLPESARAQAVAISIEDRRGPEWTRTAGRLAPRQMEYLFEKPLGSYSAGELGRFRIITDMFGGFSYTDQLTAFMEKVLDLLDTNGSFYSVLQDVRPEQGESKPYYAGAPFLTTLSDADGSELKVCTWLKRISCVEVSCQARPDWKPPIEIYQVRKTCGEVRVPPLERTGFKAGTPPERRFAVSNPSLPGGKR